MKKIKLNLILLIALVPLLTFCGGVRDALEGKKRSEQSDEFLVKKKIRSEEHTSELQSQD